MGHALAGAHLQQVGLELGEHGQHVEEHLGHGIGGVVDAPAEGQADAAGVFRSRAVWMFTFAQGR
jgi:hypothetical protein